MAIVQREIRKRGIVGKIVKWAFILFNGVMVFWIVSYWVTVGDLMETAASDAERAGGAIGAAMGTGALFFLWMVGAVVLGLMALLTRGQKILITEDSK